MFSSSNPPGAAPTRSSVLIIASGLLALLPAGCASPGVPRPPSLNLVRPASDLAAQRIGNQVLLTWTTPDRTTDNLDLKPPLTARICRSPVFLPNQQLTTSNPQPPLPCNQVVRLATRPGPATATDTLPSNLTAEPATLLEYSVELVNAAGRSAGLSAPAYAASGMAPAPVESLRATAIPTGVMLEWIPSSAPAFSTFVDLQRTDATLQAAQAQSKSANKQPFQPAGKPSPQTHLRAQTQSAVEPLGTLDQTARFGDTYIYSAQRLRSIVLDGHALYLASPPSAPVAITPRDTFPPAAPTGLAAIPNRQPTSIDLAGSIDLSWQPNSEPDLAGYLVYRRAVPQSGPPARLTPAPIPATGYRDLTAIPGERFAYSVTATDTSGNESKPSTEVEEMALK